MILIIPLMALIEWKSSIWSRISFSKIRVMLVLSNMLHYGGQACSDRSLAS